MSWTPSEGERKYLELLVSMTLEILSGRGVDKETFVLNTELIVNAVIPDSLTTKANDPPDHPSSPSS